MELFKTWRVLHFKEKNKAIRIETYFVEISEEPKAPSEINEIKWIGCHYAEQA